MAAGESLTPKKGREEDASKALEAWLPWALGGPASLVAGIVPTIAGQALRKGSEWMGYGSGVQTGAQVAGELMGSLLGNVSTFAKMSKNQYAKADAIIPKTTEDFTGMYKKTDKFIKNLKKNSKGSTEKLSLRRAAIEKAEELISKDTGNLKRFGKNKNVRVKGKVKDITEFKKSVNSLAAKNPEMYELVEILNDGISSATAKNHPEWFKEWSLADKYHGMKVERTALGNLIAKNETLGKIFSNPYIEHILSGGAGLILGTHGAAHHAAEGVSHAVLPIASKIAAGAGTVILAGKLHKAVDMIVRHPETVGKLFLDVYKYGLMGNVAKLASTGIKLNKKLGFQIGGSNGSSKGYIL